ncbi:hypothetical protein [Brevibacillus migulae]|uniref:hypothetical protein n=1 Tax=Brevibacillus migulae TaxID=1644114 RepID=UPI00106E7DCC|nr:hypothetical protein [Brevibacillus migulae]
MTESTKKSVTRAQRNWLVILHLITTVLFVGGSFCQWVLLLTILNTSNGDVLYVSHSLMHTVDIALIIPGLLGVTITGIMLSMKTQWGFFKFYWIINKEIITLLTLILGSVLNIYVRSTIELSFDQRLQALQNPVYLQDRQMLVVLSIIQTSMLIYVIVISILKPWGKRKGKSNPSLQKAGS